MVKDDSFVGHRLPHLDVAAPTSTDLASLPNRHVPTKMAAYRILTKAPRTIGGLIITTPYDDPWHYRCYHSDARGCLYGKLSQEACAMGPP